MLLQFLNSWRSSIVWELTHSGRDEVPFLDLSLSISNMRLDYGTFRKVPNAYLYLPRGSCHNPSVFSSLIHGEVNRLITTNKSAKAFEHQLSFFTGKLVARGYDRSFVSRVARSALHVARRRFTQPPPHKRPYIRKHFIPIVYSASTNYSLVRRSIAKYRVHIQHLGHVGVSSRVQRNLFRQLYAINWPRAWPG